MLLPVLLAELALLLPGTLVPDELQVVREILAQPLVRTVGKVHAHVVFHVLVGDGEEPELADEVSDFVTTPRLLHPPNGLRQRIGPSPCSHVDGALVGFVGQTDEQTASLRVITLANSLDAAVSTAHHGAAPDVLDAWPVADMLPALTLQRHERRLPRPPHQLRHILAVSLDDAVQILCPFCRIGVAVPAYRRDNGLNLEHVGVCHQSDHRLHVVGFNVSWCDVSTHHEPRLQPVLLLRLCQLLLNRICSGIIVFALLLTGECHGGGSSLGDGEGPYPLVALVLPTALDEACSRTIRGFEMVQPAVGDGAHDDMLEARTGGVGSDAGTRLPNPLADDAVGIVVEAVHAVGPHALIPGVAVPAFPDGGCSVVDGVEPAGVLALEEQGVGHVGHAVVCQRGHQDGGAEEARLKAVAVLSEVLAQALNHPVLGIAVEELVVQGEEGGCLHGVEDRRLKGAVGIEEVLSQIVLGLSHHRVILSGVAPRGPGHVAHHGGIDGPVGGAQVVPVVDGLGQRLSVLEGSAAAALQRLVAQPVGPLVVAVLLAQCHVVVLRRADVAHVSRHRLPALLDNRRIAILLPDGPGHDDAGIGPPHAHILVLP